MLDVTTRRRIDTARDILVGKVPDPKSQVEQITIALIYKFMDDMDAESEELGGERKFFAGEFARYGWAKLMRSGLGGHETLNLYAEAITKMPENPGIPPLFRDIFKNAFLPYRDPETLRAFLKVIDEFEYDHSERLGDAFEYLLSVLGSQGDAGQFRTPRHIIDFIVEIVDPKKNETVLDPACGTAGFLISSYKHILKANTDAQGQSTLAPEERGRLAANFTGYDISPDMVRLSLVNMYLHGFADPHISEYDTLTSLDRWSEHADVIVANPPFMSPKGGIRPHNKFGVQSKRSEVLFVDYMAEHLTPNGRAGIIVPEGIIFQSQTAYKQLRKMLVEEYLVAVVSLPAGVFQPYSGVKTSILILDKSLAKKADTIGFFKVESDGFDLGAQRRPIDRNDLPQVLGEIEVYLGRLQASESVEDAEYTLGLIVAKEKVAANGDYGLGGERYRVSTVPSHVALVEVGSVAGEIKAGFACGDSGTGVQGVPHVRPMNITEQGVFTWDGMKKISESEFAGREDYELCPGDVLFNNTNSKELVGKTCLVREHVRGGFSNHMTRIRVLQDACLPAYLAYVLHSAWSRGAFQERANKWIGQAGINSSSLSQFEIPLPPLDMQRAIVAEIEGYQRVMDGARAVVENYRPHIDVDREWPVVDIGSLCTVERGASPRPIHNFITDSPEGVNWIKIGDAAAGTKYIDCTKERITREGAAKSRHVKPGDFVLSNSMSFGRPYIMATEGCIHDGWLLLRDLSRGLNQDYLYYILGSDLVMDQFKRAATGGVVNNLNSELVRRVTIPLPSPDRQREIAAELEAEQRLVDANRQLIRLFERRIEMILDRVWGEVS